MRASKKFGCSQVFFKKLKKIETKGFLSCIDILVMMRISKIDLGQMDRQYFQSLEKDALVDVSCRLHATAVELTECLNQNSTNSSRPPSSDNPYKKNPKNKDSSKNNNEQEKTDSDPTEDSDSKNNDEQGQTDSHPAKDSDSGIQPESDLEKDSDSQSPSDENPETEPDKRPPGRQKGSQGFWRKEKPEAKNKEHHFPPVCDACGIKLDKDPTQSPYMGYYTYELENGKHWIRIDCTLHLYYATECQCGHENIERPGQGYVSVIEGRKRNLKLTEHTIVGPMLATYISLLSRDYGMSRNKIHDFLIFSYYFELGVGTIDKCIREAGVASFPVVERLVEGLQKEELVHLDETSWREKGTLLWLWVAISGQIAVFHIGTRKKEELLKLITEAFFGWLVTDGYGAYRSYEKRQRCLAHLIRKAVALTEAVDGKAQKMGDWFLRELKGMITAMAQGEDGTKECWPILARLKRACNLGSKSDHDKLRALAKEILNDWDAVVAFVKNPGLPATNNEAERALRWAVILRKIGFGTRTDEGSRSIAALLSVIKTCRLRNVNHWDYIAKVIAAGRKGDAPPPIPPA